MLSITLGRVTVEVVSTIVCLILVRFMIKPYQLTREARYLGLPIGFGFLGISYALSAVAFVPPFLSVKELAWLQFLVRTYAFVFIAETYYFSKKPKKNTRILWDIALSLGVVTFVASFLALLIAPAVSINSYNISQLYIRVFNVLCLSYIAIHTLRSHIKQPDPTTIWIPLGFILLGLSQYSVLFYYTDGSLAAFTGSLVTRLMSLAIFLLVAYRSFYSSDKDADK
jgi:hypothetical protein